VCELLLGRLKERVHQEAEIEQRRDSHEGRSWDGAEHIPAASAKKAAGQYRKTRAQLMKLAAEAGEDAQTKALEVVTAYTQTFNRMNFIETEERDEIYMALCGILDALPDSILWKDILLEKFEELRDF